jgi:hypothetical protein
MQTPFCHFHKRSKNIEADIVIIPDLTQEQRKEEAEMNNEAERRNQALTQEDRAKNLQWMVVGARGEKRIVKGTARARGGGSGPPAARGRGGLAPPLLPPRLRQGPWDPAAGRGAGSSLSARMSGGTFWTWSSRICQKECRK